MTSESEPAHNLKLKSDCADEESNVMNPTAYIEPLTSKMNILHQKGWTVTGPLGQ